jgi:hypothetical protein
MRDPFQQLVNEVLSLRGEPVKITQEQFDQFKHGVLFDLIRDVPYGQAFCNKFGVDMDMVLWLNRNIEFCDDWIKNNYIV